MMIIQSSIVQQPKLLINLRHSVRYLQNLNRIETESHRKKRFFSALEFQIVKKQSGFKHIKHYSGNTDVSLFFFWLKNRFVSNIQIIW